MHTQAHTHTHTDTDTHTHTSILLELRKFGDQYPTLGASLVAQLVKNLPAMEETLV